MSTRILGPTASRRRRRFVLAPVFLVVLVALVAISSASGVLPGSPSNFEGGNDPSLGLGNMIVDTTGNSDWISVAGISPNYVHLTDAGASNSDDSFTPGQKQDTACPTVEGHKNPPKDDFTDVASFTEVNTTAGDPNEGDIYLYGATIRFAPNGNASENIELKQGLSGECVDSPGLLERTPGDKLIAIDYLGGGSAVEFHVLTWVASGPCFVANDPNPCWGATVLELDPTEAEGGVNNAAITAANNPISGVALKAGQFAEFGVNLSDAGIIPPGVCQGFSQTIWESRSSGSSFVSSTKDITIEDNDINVCGSADVTKVGSDAGSQEGAVFTLYEGSVVGGTVVGTCTVDASGHCVNDADPTAATSFPNLQPGTYTIDETTVPAGYGKDPDLPETFTVAALQSVSLSYTDPALEGALAILKNSTKGGAVANAGAVFSYGVGLSVTDNGTGDEDSDIGQICVSGLDPGAYTVNETSPPAGYGDASEVDQVVTVVNGTDCTDPLKAPGAGATATFTNPPLADIQVNFRDGGSGETTAGSTINCVEGATDLGDNDATPTTGWDKSETHLGLDPGTYVCTIVVDP
jgi:hypothetical protein